jgi:hypothetical protein
MDRASARNDPAGYDNPYISLLFGEAGAVGYLVRLPIV